MDSEISSYIFTTFTCHGDADLEWKLIYVGSAEDETYDQLLESVLVGPVNVGNYRFMLQAILTDSLFQYFLADLFGFLM